MSYFLSNQTLEPGQLVSLTGPEASHMLLSRRLKLGEMVFLQDPSFRRCEAIIEAITKNSISLRVVQVVLTPPELLVAITLFQAVVSEKALDFIFQKATELGAAEVILFNSHNVAAKLSQEKFGLKKERWSKILWESAKQSDRAHIPRLGFVDGMDQIISNAKSFERNFIFDVNGSKIENVDRGRAKKLSIVVGPEGGFTGQEIAQLKKMENIELVSISPFTLRAETAAIAGLSIIQSIN